MPLIPITSENLPSKITNERRLWERKEVE